MSGVLDQTDFVVKRRPQLMEVRAGYDVYDQLTMSAVGQVEQVGRDNNILTIAVRGIVRSSGIRSAPTTPERRWSCAIPPARCC